jgi:hypothetical protein
MSVRRLPWVGLRILRLRVIVFPRSVVGGPCDLLLLAGVHVLEGPAGRGLRGPEA